MLRGTIRSLLPIQLQQSMPANLIHQVPIESGTPDRQELSEVDCDIDSLKKLKLGVRSSLWLRPNSNTGGAQPQESQVPEHQSDYSIAVWIEKPAIEYQTKIWTYKPKHL